jgi:hypothetical protein
VEDSRLMSITESMLRTPDSPFFTSHLGGAGGVWLVSMNRLVLRLSGDISTCTT